MKFFDRQFFIKFLLIVFAEFLAIAITDSFSMYVIPIKHTNLSYVVFGALLAYLVVFLYDYHTKKKNVKIKQEIQNLSDVAMLRYQPKSRDKEHQ